MSKIGLVCFLLCMNVFFINAAYATDYWCDIALYNPDMTETTFCKDKNGHEICKFFYEEVIKLYKNNSCIEIYKKNKNIYGANCEIIFDKKTNEVVARKCVNSDGSINYAALDKSREIYK